MKIKKNEKLNKYANNFDDKVYRKKIIEEFKNSKSCYFGENKNKEDIELHIAPDGIILKTYQENGHLRVDTYDSSGTYSGTTYEGRWK